MACINICIVSDSKTTNYNFSFKYPHSTDGALTDLARLQLWCTGNDFVFNRFNQEQAFVLNGFSNIEKIGELISFIDENVKLYHEIQVIENDLDERLILDKELTTEDIRHIQLASSSVTPNHVKYTGSYSINVGKMSLKQLGLYNSNLNTAVLQMTYTDVLPEDCFKLLGKNIVLGIRKICLIEPYIINITEATRAAEESRDVVLQFASKKNEAILEYVSLSSDSEIIKP